MMVAISAERHIHEDLVNEDLLDRGSDDGLCCEYVDKMMTLSLSLWAVMAVMLTMGKLRSITLVLLPLELQ